MKQNSGEFTRIYFDATDFLLHLTHSDSVTGIQRVTQQMILNVPKWSGANPVFFSYATGRFYELPQDLFDFKNRANRFRLQKIGKHIAHTLRVSTGEDTRFVTRLRGRIREYQMSTPSPFRSKVYVSGLRTVRFNRGDQLVISGAIWGMDGYSRALREVSDRYGVAVTFFAHDIVPLRFPEFVEGDTTAKFVKYMQEIMPFCRSFICNSESTKADIQSYLREHRAKIPTAVVPLAHEFISGSGFPPRSGFPAGLRSKYVLCVGTIEPRKNHLRLALAFRAAIEELGDSAPQLVIAGKRGWGTKEFYHLMSETKCLDGRITLIENPSDIELELLYRSCEFTVYPSLFEGWGLPVGESLWFRKRCAASRAGAIPEVSSEAVDYFDPLNVASMAAAIVRHTKEPETIAHFNDKVLKAGLRSWAHFGTDMLNVLQTGPDG